MHDDPAKRGGYLLLLQGKVPEIVLDGLADTGEQERAEQRCLQELEAMRAREPKSRTSGSAGSSAGSPGRSQLSQRSQVSQRSQLSGRSQASPGRSVDTIPNEAPPAASGPVRHSGGGREAALNKPAAPAAPVKKPQRPRKATLEDRTQFLVRLVGVLVAVSMLGAAGMVFKLHRDAEARLRSIAGEVPTTPPGPEQPDQPGTSPEASAAQPAPTPAPAGTDQPSQ